jgi:predicted RNA polymerase sigma factor
VQAAIAAVHAEAPTAAETDWPQIVKLYEVLLRIAPNPMAALSHAVAVAMVDGPAAGLELLDGLDGASRAAVGHRLDAVRAHLLDLAGNASAARAAYLASARGTTSLPEQRYLQVRATRIATEFPP